MTRVVMNDDRVVAALDAIPQRAEICDASGRVLGYFVPSSAPLVFYRGIRSPLSAEERERLIREGEATARPLPEFWEAMKKKHPDEFE